MERQRKIIDFTLSSLAEEKRKERAPDLCLYPRCFCARIRSCFSPTPLREKRSLVLKEAPEMIVQKDGWPAETDPQSRLIYMDKITKIRGVSSVRGTALGPTIMNPGGGPPNYTLNRP